MKIQDLLDARIIKMYETPKFEFLQVILASKNVTEFLSTYYAMKELAEYDNKLLDTVKQQKQDIETRPVWKPMHMQPVFKKYPFFNHNKKGISVSEELFNTGVCLPSDTNMTKKEQERVIEIIRNLFV